MRARIIPALTALAAAALIASACGSSGYENSFEIPSTISTDSASTFTVGKIFIDARNPGPAFLVLHEVEEGVVGEPVQGFQVPLGRTDPLTVQLEEENELSLGLQQFQVTVFIDNPESPNGKLDSDDPIAKAGGEEMQDTVTVEYTSSLASYVDFETVVETDEPREFDLGMISIREEDTDAEGVVFIAGYKDDNGSPGDLLGVREFQVGREQRVSLRMESPNRLVGGEQTVHVLIHFDDPQDREFDPDEDPVGELDGERLEYEFTVTLTDDRLNPALTLEDSLSITTPFEFEVGTYTLPTEPGTRFWGVTRLIEDGEPGKVLGVNEIRQSFDERTLKVKLDHQVRVRDQRIHFGIYPNRTGMAWTVDNFDTDAEPLTDDQGDTLEGEIDVEFISTVEDPDAEFYPYTCGDDDNAARSLMYKTGLKVDCRCAINRVNQPTYEICNAMAANANGYTRGNGPSFEPLGGHMTSGDVFPDRDEIIFGIDRGGSDDPRRRKFAIVALNYKTNTRRFVSGEVKDPFMGEYTIGQGPLSGEASYIRRGPNGEMFVISNYEGGEILRVDPDTGDREILWRRDDPNYGQCPNGVPIEGDADWRLGDSQPATYQLNYEGRGFTVDPRDKSFYVATRNNGVPNPGFGVVKISPDGSTCTVLSTSEAEERNDYYGGVGTGYEIKYDIKSMMWHKGKLLAIAGSDLLEIDPDTGNRTRIVGGDITGSSAVPAVYRMFWNEDLELLMLTGVLPPNNPNIVAVDLETRKVWGFKCLNPDEDGPVVSCMRGPQETLHIAYWPSYQLPDGTFLGGIFRYGFTRYELFQGNSYIYNY